MAALEAAEEYTNLLEIDQSDKDIVVSSLNDLVSESPKTTVAATKFKKVITKAGTESLGAMKQILIGVLSETAKKVIWPNS